MTTLERSETADSAPPSAAPVAAPRGLAGLLSSGDHKTIGRMWLIASLLFGCFSLVCGLLLNLESTQTPNINVFLGVESYWQVFSLYRVGMVFLFAVPLFIGLATYLVPLQVGASSSAFPRAGSAAFWLWLLGGVIIIASWGIDGGLALGGAQRSVELSLLAFAMVVLALLVAVVVLLTTILTQRAEGMRLTQVPMFTWSMLVAGAVWLLTLPVLLANLVVMWVDLRGASAARYGVGENLYEQVAWVFEQPQIFAFLIPALGVIVEIVPLAFGVSLRNRGLVLVLLGLIGAFCFGAEMQSFFSPTADTTPIYVAGGILLVLFLVSLPLTLLSNLRRSSKLPSPTAHLALAVAAVFLMLASAAVALIRVLGGAVGFLRSFDSANASWQSDLDSALAPLDDLRGSAAGGALMDLVLVTAVTAAFAGLFYWAPKLFGKSLLRPAGFAAPPILLIGGLGLGIVGLVAAFSGQPELPGRESTSAVAQGVSMITSASAALVLLIVGMILLAVLLATIAVIRGAQTHANPWSAHTLEWSVSSPPPLSNFASAPVVRSSAPLLDSPLDSPSEEGAASEEGSGSSEVPQP